MNRRQLRAEFWRQNPQFRRVAGKSQNQYPADIRMAWSDFVDYMARIGAISERVAQSATL